MKRTITSTLIGNEDNNIDTVHHIAYLIDQGFTRGSDSGINEETKTQYGYEFDVSETDDEQAAA